MHRVPILRHKQIGCSERLWRRSFCGIDWGWHYEVRISEWADPPPYNNNKPGIRPTAVRFMYFHEVFKNMITITYP
jgi:hypothetical protein